LSFVWYKNLDISFFRFVTVHACDRRTDRILIAIPRLHYIQRGKKSTPFSEDDKAHLFKGYGSRRLLAEFIMKNWMKGGFDTPRKKVMKTGSSD